MNVTERKVLGALAFDLAFRDLGLDMLRFRNRALRR